MMTKLSNTKKKYFIFHIIPMVMIALSSMACIDTVAADAATEYRFDILLFENKPSKQSHLADDSAQEFLKHKIKNSVKQETPSSTTTHQIGDATLNFQTLDTGELDDAAKKLDKAGQYNILFRKTWSQLALADGDSVEIRLDPGESPERESPNNFNQQGTVSTVSNAAQSNYLAGNLHLIFSRYIHLKTDINLQHRELSDDATYVNGNVRRISNVQLERKMRSNETHYIDHPLIGILINIQRIRKDQS